MLQQIEEAVEFLKTRINVAPRIGVILGTGLGNQFVSHIENAVSIPYSEIPNFPVATVEYHHGHLIHGFIQGKPVIVMQGRFHYYEGYHMQQITLPVRVMKMLGVQYMLISNAAGNMNRSWRKGELMLLDDHINLLPENPLRGKNEKSFGPRFPDMSEPYSPYLNKLLHAIAERKNITLREGVYVSVSGPNLETRAEYRFLQRIGADAVGMSTVPEVIVCNHMKLPCCAISVLTDDCDPDNLKPVSLEEIIAIAGQAEVKLTDLFLELISQIEIQG
jgi:purine-nucleoside phosphorylase